MSTKPKTQANDLPAMPHSLWATAMQPPIVSLAKIEPKSKKANKSNSEAPKYVWIVRPTPNTFAAAACGKVGRFSTYSKHVSKNAEEPLEKRRSKKIDNKKTEEGNECKNHELVQVFRSQMPDLRLENYNITEVEYFRPNFKTQHDNFPFQHIDDDELQRLFRDAPTLTNDCGREGHDNYMSSIRRHLRITNTSSVPLPGTINQPIPIDDVTDKGPNLSTALIGVDSRTKQIVNDLHRHHYDHKPDEMPTYPFTFIQDEKIKGELYDKLCALYENYHSPPTTGQAAKKAKQEPYLRKADIQLYFKIVVDGAPDVSTMENYKWAEKFGKYLDKHAANEKQAYDQTIHTSTTPLHEQPFISMSSVRNIGEWGYNRMVVRRNPSKRPPIELFYIKAIRNKVNTHDPNLTFHSMVTDDFIKNSGWKPFDA